VIWLSKNRKKLYIIGIDSVPVWIIKAALKENKLPGFQHFFESGFIDNMESTLPPVTAAAWPSIYTGTGPGKHGVMEFFGIDSDYSKRLMYYDSEESRPFWNVLADKGLKSLIITPAMVLKAGLDPNVDLVTGFPLPPKYNSKRLEEVAKRIGFKGEENVESLIKDGRMSLAEGSDIYRKSVRKRIDFAKILMDSRDYDLVFVCFTETDRIQHYSLGSGIDTALKYNAPVLKEIDTFIEWIYKRIKGNQEDAAVMVVSDHGAQGLKKKFLLNTWMINNGFAKLKPAVERQINEMLSGRGRKEMKSSIKYRLREKLVGTGAEIVYQKMPGSMKKLASKSMSVGPTISKNGDYVRVHDLNFDNFDIGNTKAFGAVSTNPVGMIWINDDRFDKPSVSKSEKKKVKNEIIRMLSSEKGFEGGRLAKKVYDGDEYYGDTKKFIHPDILVLLNDGYGVDTFNFAIDTLFIDPNPILNGDHTEDAMFGIFGRGIKLQKLKGAHVKICDFAPTVYSYFGLRIGGLDGKSLI
jgi:predicted AlkP superfamily phosphohydrolase/phosphomutase